MKKLPLTQPQLHGLMSFAQPGGCAYGSGPLLVKKQVAEALARRALVKLSKRKGRAPGIEVPHAEATYQGHRQLELRRPPSWIEVSVTLDKKS